MALIDFLSASHSRDTATSLIDLEYNELVCYAKSKPNNNWYQLSKCNTSEIIHNKHIRHKLKSRVSKIWEPNRFFALDENASTMRKHKINGIFGYDLFCFVFG